MQGLSHGGHLVIILTSAWCVYLKTYLKKNIPNISGWRDENTKANEHDEILERYVALTLERTVSI